jgi:AraC-like DNA-binding protein
MKIEKCILSDDIDIAYRSDDTFNMDFHFHDVYEIYHSISGGKHIMINDVIYPVSPYDLFVMSNFDIHKIITTPGVPYIRHVVTFNPAIILPDCTVDTNLLSCFIRNSPQQAHRIHLSKEEHLNLTKLYKKYALLTKGYGYDILRKSVLMEVLVFINLCFMKHQDSVDLRDNDTTKDTHYNTYIRPLLDYIQDHLTEPLSLDILADQLHTNKHHMCKQFKRYTGTTINTYIIARRISLAKNLLHQDLTVTEVCHASGFRDYAHFIRTFTKLVGLSPRKYAKKSSLS